MDTVFRNMRLDVELVDVSNGGVVRFEDVKLANVSLNHGMIMSTSWTDYVSDAEWQHTAADDADFDVEYRPVPVTERSMFGEEFLIADQIMSDCLHMTAADGPALPGCPLASTQQQQAMSRQSAKQSGAGAARTIHNPYASIDQYLLTEDNLRQFQLQAAIQPMPHPSAHSPSFNMAPPANPKVRTSLTLQLPMPPGTSVPALTWTPEAVAAAREAMNTSGRPQGSDKASSVRVTLIAAVALVAVIATIAALWASWSLRRLSAKHRRSLDDKCQLPWPRQFPYWTVRNLKCTLSCVTHARLLQIPPHSRCLGSHDDCVTAAFLDVVCVVPVAAPMLQCAHTEAARCRRNAV